MGHIRGFEAKHPAYNLCKTGTGQGRRKLNCFAHVYKLNSTTRTRPDPHGLFCGETPLGPCGSGRVRVVEFSYMAANIASDVAKYL